MDKLINILADAGKVKVAVIGDFMLDKYVWGEVRRISQEAPIQVLNVRREEARPGGAGNVVYNLTKLGADVYSCGTVGADKDGEIIVNNLKELGADVAGIFRDATRATTVKTRMMGHLQTAGKGVQQLLRVDYEDTHLIPSDIENKINDYIKSIAHNCDIILISDMDKGLLTNNVLNSVRAVMADRSIPVIVDPKLGGDYFLYKGFTAITPNRYETELSSDIKITGIESMNAAAKKLADTLGFAHVLITVDKDGMFLFHKAGDSKLISTAPKEVNDVSGAGDVVISVIGYLTGAGNSFEDAAKIANVAAGIEVEKIGAVPVGKDEILKELAHICDPLSGKIKTIDELKELLDKRRKDGKKVVFTNGCFDLLHVGHIEYLKFARKQGDVFVVGLNSDTSVRSLKGPTRPLVSENDRAKLLAALEDVDYVVLFNESTPEDLIKELKPDALVKGEDWREAGVVGRDFVESYGGKVVLAPLVEGISTSNIVSRIVENHKNTTKTDNN